MIVRERVAHRIEIAAATAIALGAVSLFVVPALGGAHSSAARDERGLAATSLRPVVRLDHGLVELGLPAHTSGVSQHYVRHTGGVEQRFTITRAASRQRELTLIAGRIAASAKTREAAGGLAIYGGDGLVTYGGLKVTDALGRTLPAAIQLAGRAIRLRIDTVGATYPLTVDPYAQVEQLSPPDATNLESYGYAVAIDGDTLVSTAPNFATSPGTGEVFVYEQTSPGDWTLEQTLEQKQSEPCEFGTSAAISDGTIAIGCPAAEDAGWVYIYTEAAGVWSQTPSQVLAGSNTLGDGEFGYSVALEDGTLVVGAPWADDSGATDGAVCIYTSDGGAWQPDGTIFGPSPGNYFGWSVATTGDDTIFVGAINTNSVYVLTQPSGDDWTSSIEESGLPTPDTTGSDDRIGSSLAVSGSTLVVGAVNVAPDAGYALVYEEPSGEGWAEAEPVAQLEPSGLDGGLGDNTGGSVAIDGSNILVADGSVESNQNDPRQNTYVFSEPSGGWSGTLTGDLLTSTGGVVAADNGTVATGDPDASGTSPANGDTVTDAGSVTSFVNSSSSSGGGGSGGSGSGGSGSGSSGSGGSGSGSSGSGGSGSGSTTPTGTTSTTSSTPTTTVTNTNTLLPSLPAGYMPLISHLLGGLTSSDIAQLLANGGFSIQIPLTYPAYAGTYSALGTASSSDIAGSDAAALVRRRLPVATSAKAKKSKPVVIFTYSHHFTNTGKYKVKIKLTTAGRRLLRAAEKAHKRLKVTVTLSLTASGRMSFKQTRTITLKAKR